MRKVIFLIFMLSTISVNAQFMGIKGGGNLSTVWGGKLYPIPGAQAGLIYQQHINENYMIVFESNFKMEGFQCVWFNGYYKEHSKFIEIPVIYKYHPKKFDLYIGLQLNVFLDVSYNLEYFSYDLIKAKYRQIYFGVLMGGSYRIGKNYNLDLRFVNSVSNVSSLDSRVSCASLSLSLEYIFPNRLF